MSEKTIFHRFCPNQKCRKKIYYQTYDSWKAAKEKKTRCKSCAQPEFKLTKTVPPSGGFKRECPKNCGTILYYDTVGEFNSAIKDNRCCRNCYLKTLKNCKPETRRKLREAMLKRVEDLGGFPNFNPTACTIFDEINKEMNWNGIHALNGGEFKVCGYSVDFYEPSKNIVIEYFEKAHKNSIEKDSFRQNEIIKELNCKFYIIKEWEHSSWKDVLFG